MGRRSTRRAEIVSLGDVRREEDGDHVRLLADEAVVRDMNDQLRTARVEQIGSFPYRFDQPHLGLPRLATQRTYRGRTLFRGQARREDDPSVAGYNRIGIWREIL